jgi:hypothetical protein
MAMGAAFAASNRRAALPNNPQPPTASGAAVGTISSTPLMGRQAGTNSTGGRAGSMGGHRSLARTEVGAVHRHDGNGGDIWIFESGKDTPWKFTFDATQDNCSRSGRRTASARVRPRRNGKWGVKVADNTRTEDLLSNRKLRKCR